MYFQKFPLVRLVLVFALGILAGDLGLLIDYYFLPSVALIGSVLFLINRYFSLKLNLIFGLGVLMLFFLLGEYRYKLVTPTMDVNHLIHHDLRAIAGYEGWLLETPKRTEKSYRLLLEVSRVYTQDHEYRSNGKVLLYTDTLIGKSLELGDIVFVAHAPEANKDPENPYVFDYKGYLEREGIFFSHFEREVVKLGHRQPNVISAFASHTRRNAVATFQEHISNESIRGIALALILGNKDELDSDITEAYAGSGAMHILAVSGLHVGLIYLLFTSIFQRLPYAIRKFPWIEVISSIFILIAYALLTGLSPSVMRAVAMFSFMAVGRALRRKASVYNSLAASAFLLLLIDPQLLFSVGFQLSYAAVIGIVYLQPKLYSLYRFENVFLNKIWAITCVSIAAQWATAPLSAFYFHQFPTYFLITNLLAIPAAFLMLIIGICALSLGFIGPLADVLFQLLAKVITFTNWFVESISLLPLGQIQGLNPTIYELLLIYALMFCLLMLFTERKPRLIYSALILSMIFGVVSFLRNARMLQTHELVVFNLPKHQVLCFRQGNQGMIWTSEEGLIHEKEFDFQVKPYLLYHQINEETLEVPKATTSLGDVAVFQGKKILILDDGEGLEELDDKIVWDFIISPELERLSVVQANKIVLTSNSYQINEPLNSDIHVMSKDGYFNKTW